MPFAIIIIPVYNHAEGLGAVLDGCLRYFPAREIMVVDDGSTDYSSAEAGRRRVHLRRHGHNLGKGRALITGFNWALEHGAEWVICLDADGQHRPEEIPMFLRAAREHDYDLILGIRQFRQARIPWTRLLSNRFSAAVLSKLTGQAIADSQCGYRMIRMDLIRKMELKSNDYMIESEMLLQASKLKARFGFVPIAAVYRGEKSHIRSIRIVGRFFRTIWRTRDLWSGLIRERRARPA